MPSLEVETDLSWNATGQYVNIAYPQEEKVSKHNLLKTVVIFGDIHLNLIKYISNKFTNNLKNLGCNQLVNTSTHIMGGIIDNSPQVYIVQNTPSVFVWLD